MATANGSLGRVVSVLAQPAWGLSGTGTVAAWVGGGEAGGPPHHRGSHNSSSELRALKESKMWAQGHCPENMICP